jgi:hypothetical protein
MTIFVDDAYRKTSMFMRFLPQYRQDAAFAAAGCESADADCPCQPNITTLTRRANSLTC